MQVNRTFSAAVISVLLFFPLSAFGQSDTIETTVPHLKDVFAGDFSIGCLLSYPHIGFATDPYVPGQSGVVAPNGGALIKYHMNGMSPGNNMKPQYTVDIAGSAAAYAAAPTQAEKDSIELHPIVRFNGNLIAQLNWAQRQGFTFRGHTLVWHSQTPAEFFRSGYTTAGARLTKAMMTQRLENYIHDLVALLHQSWPGMLSAFDVVNESVNDNGTFRTASNEWYTTFGDTTYVKKAFELARQYTVLLGEAQIKLYYNDYNTSNAAKANGIVALCTPIFQAGLLDGIGMQEHDNLSTPTAQAFIDSYNKFAPICTEMAITELDVATGSSSPSAAVLRTQANQYGSLFKCFVERSFRSGRGKIINVSKDGLNDQYTFVTNSSSSLWTSLNKCKPAFFAVVDVGNYYNAVDSLLAIADALPEAEYTTDSWALFAAARASARNARDRNYTASTSAADTLHLANDALSAALAGLEKVTNGIPDPAGTRPLVAALSQNYPNPFNPTTEIQYTIPDRGAVSLKVYNLLGAEVATLVDGVREAGRHIARFNAGSLPSGVYLYRLQTGAVSIGKRLLLMK